MTAALVVQDASDSSMTVGRNVTFVAAPGIENSCNDSIVRHIDGAMDGTRNTAVMRAGV